MSRHWTILLATCAAAAAITLACADTPELQAERERRRNPVSVRGWIWDIDAPAPGMSGTFSVTSPVAAEAERRRRLFADTNLAVENVTNASGALLENGSFIILDAPPRQLTVVFQTPVLGDHTIPMSNVPPNADVFLPGIVITSQGIRFAEPEKIHVWIPGQSGAPRPTGQMAQIGPHSVEVVEVPVADLVARRDYPTPEPPASELAPAAAPNEPAPAEAPAP